MKTRALDKYQKMILGAFVLFGCIGIGEVATHAVRNRSYWLDEAFLIQDLQTKSSIPSILFGGALGHTQQFPKIYFSMIALIHKAAPDSDRWPRSLPLAFGVSSIIVWLHFFYDYFWIKRKQGVACLIAGGMLIANSWIVRYAYELKPYSADLFFTGLLFALYQTERLSDRQKAIALVFSILLSVLFSYAVVFVIAALVLSTLLTDERRRWWNNRRWLLLLIIIGLPLIAWLYKIDYSQGLNSNTLRSYWAPNFAHGHNTPEKLHSLRVLAQRFLTDWWRTDGGPLPEELSPGAWYVWPYRTMKHPDLKNLIYVLTLVLLGGSFWNLIKFKNPERDILLPCAFLIVEMALAAWFSVYPWSIERLTLYAMPVCVLLIVSSIQRLVAIADKNKWSRKMRFVFWGPFLWLIIRNTVYVAAAWAIAPYPQDVETMLRKMSQRKSNIVVVAQSCNDIFKSISVLPEGYTFYYEDQMSRTDLTAKLRGKPFYFVWAHYLPAFDSSGQASQFSDSYTTDAVYTGPSALGMGMYLLSPESSIAAPSTL